MAITPTNLSRSILSTTSGTILYTANTSGGAVLNSIVVNNNSLTNATFNLAVSGSTTYPIFNNTTVTGNASIFVNTHQVLASGQSIIGNSNVVSTITVHLNGVVIN